MRWADLFRRKSGEAFGQLVRSIIASNGAFLIDLGILWAFTELLGVYYLVSSGIGFVVGTTVAYALNILWVFGKRRLQNRPIEYAIFFLIGLMGLIFNEVLIWYFSERVGTHYLVSKVVSGTTVFFFNFLSRKYLLFR